MDNQKPEQGLLEGLRSGDSRAVKSLYRDIYPPLEHFLYQSGANSTEARELFQDSLLVLFLNLQKAEFELHCSVKTYLFSVARNLWLKRLREKKREMGWPTAPGPELIALEEGSVETRRQLEERYDAVVQALNQAPADCLELLEAFYFRKLPLKKIAERMGYSANFVKIKKKRCLEGLKKRVGGDGVE